MNERPVALITGASRGIGAETAREFAQHGYDCFLLADEPERLEEVASSIKESGAQAFAFHGDLCELDFARHAVERCVEQWGRIDVLVNNAAWREVVTMRRIELSSWEKTLRICLTVPAFLAKWCAEVMEPARRGVILNISSIQSRFAGGNSPAYIAAKGGLDSLTYELAALYGPSGIRVLSVNPGAIDTDLSKQYGSEETDQSLRNYVEGMIPLRRYGRPSEIAKSLVMLAGDSASYLTGTCIDIDGGWSHQCTPYALKNMQMPDEFMISRKSLPDV